MSKFEMAPSAKITRSHHETEVTILAKVRPERAPILRWGNPYEKDKQPKTYMPLINEYGAVEYRKIPFAYAERLLRGEPYKYSLLAPSTLLVKMHNKTGGYVDVVLKAVVPLMDPDKDEVQKDNLDRPIYVSPDAMKEYVDKMDEMKE